MVDRGASKKVSLQVDLIGRSKDSCGPFILHPVQATSESALQGSLPLRSQVIGRDRNAFQVTTRDVRTLRGGVNDTLLRLGLYYHNGREGNTCLGFSDMSVEKLMATATGQLLLWWASNNTKRNMGRVMLVEEMGAVRSTFKMVIS